MNIVKGLGIIFLSSFVGIFFYPDCLTASDSLTLSDLDQTFVVETVEKPAAQAVTPEVASQPAQVTAQVATPVVQTVKPVISAPVYTAPANNIQIGGRNIQIINTANTSNNSGNYVYRYKEKFLYGHNTSGVFGVLYNVGEGAVFSVTIDGDTTNYRVKKVAVYQKVNDYTLNLDGTDISMSVVAKARCKGVNYDLALMTCYGTSYGNGDASHRLVLFADVI